MVGYSILRIRKLLFWSNDWLYSKIICICPTILLRCYQERLNGLFSEGAVVDGGNKGLHNLSA